jgi:hypothetical protein
MSSMFEGRARVGVMLEPDEKRRCRD